MKYCEMGKRRAAGGFGFHRGATLCYCYLEVGIFVSSNL